VDSPPPLRISQEYIRFFREYHVAESGQQRALTVGGRLAVPALRAQPTATIQKPKALTVTGGRCQMKADGTLGVNNRRRPVGWVYTERAGGIQMEIPVGGLRLLNPLRPLTAGAKSTAVLVVGLCCVLPAWSQVNTADIVGSVVDATGAIVAGAKVSAENLATRVVRSTEAALPGAGRREERAQALPRRRECHIPGDIQDQGDAAGVFQPMIFQDTGASFLRRTSKRNVRLADFEVYVFQ